MDLTAQIEAQRAQVDRLERVLWRDGPGTSRLEDYQRAFRELESLLAGEASRTRHHFVIVIPVADSPQQLRNCLDSLEAQCAAFAYGGTAQGRYRKVSVLLADDSADPVNVARNRRIAHEVDAAGITVHYFGQQEQLALLDRLGGIGLSAIIGEHPRERFAHKGQAMMRNIAYLKLAELQARHSDERLLFYTIDADQEFRVKVATPEGGRCLVAVNYFYYLDELFSARNLKVLTGKVVGDPPVSPAVMAGNFLEDVIAFVEDMAASDPGTAYRQPVMDTRGSGEAAYHDMAEMFGFSRGNGAYRYRCALPGRPSNADAFADFARHLNSFLHGEHPTRITWYRYLAVAESVQPARTVYTGNYVFAPEALGWFIPFAPLRLRMSGPTMGRILKADLADAFVSANVPMLHRRTLHATGESEYRPGLVAAHSTVDLADEFERQFFGDVLLFSMERLTASGYPARQLAADQVLATLDAVYREMVDRYRDKQRLILGHVARLKALLHAPVHWWHDDAAITPALRHFEQFVCNIERNFGIDAPALGRVAAAEVWQRWRSRQLEAVAGLRADREAWRRALATLGGSRVA